MSTGVGSSTSNFVYVQSDEYAWVPARLVSSSSHDATATVSIPTFDGDEQSICSDGKHRTKAVTKTVQLSQYPNQALPLQNVNEQGALKEVEDMVDLPFLHEAAILYNLKARHVRSKPYTRTGDIVIAVNPYKWIMDLYSTEKRLLYSNVLVWDANHDDNNNNKSTADVRSTVEPHVYETSALSYRGLAVDGQDQSILVSGESGAGKTETVKILMNHLASIQQIQQEEEETTTSSSSSSPIVVQRVVDSNPLLEAFGNAKTIRNDNSSRFGKYLQLQFDVEDSIHAAYANRMIPSCVLCGSKCQVYLLEKSRVVSHDYDEERTFHIFYQLLAASDEVKEEIWEDGLVGADMESFVYVGYSDTTVIEGLSDAERFDKTRQALELVGVVNDKYLSLMRAICIVLQLGNLTFTELDNDEDSSKIDSRDELNDLSEILGVDPSHIESALTQRTVRARSEVYKVPLKVEAAKDSCDALAKEIYSKTFLWLVRQINDATCAEYNYEGSSKTSSHLQTFGIIGLLDIFGFESFAINRFEQLCINYANEKLQQKFTQDIFQSVQAEYEYEGIVIAGEVMYEDNVDVLNLVEGRLGLIALLNEECVRPRGNDIEFVSKTKTMNKDSSSTVLKVERSFRDYEFAIIHYAGCVKYDATGFVTKNNDSLPADLLECAKQSTNPIIAQELEKEGMMNERKGSSSKKKKRPPPKSSSAMRRRPKSGGGTLIQQTVWTKFKGQLTSLMTSLSTTRTRYIRCLKPNPYKQPLRMIHLSTVEQLRCAGVVAAVTISRSAFPNRLEHELVLERFKSLNKRGAAVLSTEMHRKNNQLNNNTSDSALSLSMDDVSEHDSMTMAIAEQLKNDVNDLLTHALRPMQTSNTDGKIIMAFVIGRTRAYFRAGALEFLEAERLRGLSRWAVTIQSIIRGYMIKSAYIYRRNAAIRAVANIRCFLIRRQYVKLRRSCIVGQCWIRVKRAKALLWNMKRTKYTTDIQTCWRTYKARIYLQQCLDSVVILQALVRGSLQRPKFRAALKEKQEEDKLENKLKALQRRLEEAEQKRLDAERKAEEAKNKPPPQPAVAPQSPIVAAKEAASPEEKKALPPPASPQEQQQQQQPVLVEAAAAPAMAVAAAVTSPYAEGPPATPIQQQHPMYYPHHLAGSPQGMMMQQQQQLPPTPILTPQMQLTVQQQHLMDESGKMLEYLRKEVFKLRSQNTTLRTDFDLLKENNQRLMDANASAGASFAALNQHAKQLNKQNQRLQAEVQSYKEQFQRVNLAQVEIREELKMKQATYIAEVQSRLQYQKTLARIVDTIQDRCRDSRLVEDVLVMSDECETEPFLISNTDSRQQQNDTKRRSSSKYDPNDASVLSRFGLKSLFG